MFYLPFNKALCEQILTYKKQSPFPSLSVAYKSLWTICLSRLTQLDFGFLCEGVGG